MLIALVIISAGIAGALFVAAYILWRTNGLFTNALCVMLVAVALEILIAVWADKYLPDDLGLFAKIKMIGRGVEILGVGYFLKCLAQRRK